MRLVLISISLLYMYHGHHPDKSSNTSDDLNNRSHIVSAQEMHMATQQALNNYIEFIDRSVDEMERIQNSLKEFYRSAQAWKERPASFIRLPRVSGALEEFHYRKAIQENASLPVGERQMLNDRAHELWGALKKIDESYKSLEVYIRLKEYEQDQLHQGDKLLVQMPHQVDKFRREVQNLYTQVQTTYQKIAIYPKANAYQQAAKAMQTIMASEQKLLDTWSYNLAEDVPTGWPLEAFQQSIAAISPLLSAFKNELAGIEYPASSMYTGFGNALESLLKIKRQAIDEYTYKASQSDKHGNQIYEYLVNHYNNDMRVMYNQFVSYARQHEQYLLLTPKYCPAFAIRTVPQQLTGITAAPFRDIPVPAMSVKPQKLPITAPIAALLNQYIDFINESVRAVQHLQLVLRNYQSTANGYKGKSIQALQSRSSIDYSHSEFKIPLSTYQQVLQGNTSVPEVYRSALATQMEVLLNMLKEMDALSIELASYTAGKQYLTDHFRWSDEIVKRYVILFELFDQKKERLYEDVRRLFDAYPPADARNSWYVSGKALQQTFDHDREAIAGMKAYMAGKSKTLPATEKLNASARELLIKEYENLAGIKRIGRNNGLCPYSPYEDLAENSRLFAQNIEKLPRLHTSGPEHSYERFVYFYNNQLVYQYNTFCKLSPVSLLKAVLQPFLFTESIHPAPQHQPDTEPVIAKQRTEPPIEEVQPQPDLVKPLEQPQVAGEAGAQTAAHTRDTIYIEKTRIDTVYLSSADGGGDFDSMDGYAFNNLVFLLDVSASMNAPHKLPLLKKSVKRLVQMLRPEDEVSVVIYSGKAHILLEPTPGNQIDKISQVIDHLKSDGGTDGSAGLKLAYKLADKNYKRGGNNRIILATDGEFPINNAIYDLVEKGIRQDIYLTVFTYNQKETIVSNLQRLAERGRGRFERITPENSDQELIREAKAKRAR